MRQVETRNGANASRRSKFKTRVFLFVLAGVGDIYIFFMPLKKI